MFDNCRSIRWDRLNSTRSLWSRLPNVPASFSSRSTVDWRNVVSIPESSGKSYGDFSPELAGTDANISAPSNAAINTTTALALGLNLIPPPTPKCI